MPLPAGEARGSAAAGRCCCGCCWRAAARAGLRARRRGLAARRERQPSCLAQLGQGGVQGGSHGAVGLGNLGLVRLAQGKVQLVDLRRGRGRCAKLVQGGWAAVGCGFVCICTYCMSLLAWCSGSSRPPQGLSGKRLRGRWPIQAPEGRQDCRPAPTAVLPSCLPFPHQQPLTWAKKASLAASASLRAALGRVSATALMLKRRVPTCRRSSLRASVLKRSGEGPPGGGQGGRQGGQNASRADVEQRAAAPNSRGGSKRSCSRRPSSRALMSNRPLGLGCHWHRATLAGWLAGRPHQYFLLM